MTTILDGQAGITFPDSSVQGTAGYTGFRNKIINGAMVINQRNGSPYTVNSSTNYTLDRFEGAAVGGGVFSVTQSNIIPNNYYTNSALITVTSTASSYASSDYYFLQQKIEGYNLYDLGWGAGAAQGIAVSFWVRSSIPGTYSFHLINASANYSYVAAYTISAVNTWQYVSISVPGPTAGTWNTTNGVGVYAGWDLAAGTGRQTTSGAWTSGASFYSSTPSNIQFMSTLGATFYVTGLQIESGSISTPFERRLYGTELALCQRYYETAGRGLGGVTYSTAYANVSFTYAVVKRGTPNITLLTTTPAISQFGTGGFTAVAAAISGSAIGTAGAYIQWNGYTGLTGNTGFNVSTDPVLAISAEL